MCSAKEKRKYAHQFTNNWKLINASTRLSTTGPILPVEPRRQGPREMVKRGPSDLGVHTRRRQDLCNEVYVTGSPLERQCSATRPTDQQARQSIINKLSFLHCSPMSSFDSLHVECFVTLHQWWNHYEAITGISSHHRSVQRRQQQQQHCTLDSTNFSVYP